MADIWECADEWVRATDPMSNKSYQAYAQLRAAIIRAVGANLYYRTSFEDLRAKYKDEIDSELIKMRLKDG